MWVVFINSDELPYIYIVKQKKQVFPDMRHDYKQQACKPNMVATHVRPLIDVSMLTPTYQHAFPKIFSGLLEKKIQYGMWG